MSGHETIIVPSTGHRLAVTFGPTSSSIYADVFRFGLETQIFRREGRKIQLGNGKWTNIGKYDQEVGYTDNKDDAVEWNVVETGTGSLIKDHRGKAWTFDLTKPSHRVPIILDNVQKPESGLPKKLQELHIITGIPPPSAVIQKKRLDEVPQVLEGTVDITGANKPEKRQGQTPPPRLEIEEFRKNKKFFALYIQALIELKQLPENLITSYYQLSALHGFPRILWNNAPGQGVYCRHASPLFPTWHRPYVALFEQAIQERAIKIANGYTAEKQEWIQAAENLRQPYWDWAKERDPSFLDIFFSTLTFDVKTPKGDRHLQNPFLYYQFDSRFSKSDFPVEYQDFDKTLRHPYSKDSAESIKSSLKAAQKQLTVNTHDLFDIRTWDDFSNKGKSSGKRTGGSTSSLEAVHDTLHNLVGFNGHFTSALGAFDPLFYLHHAQVDRLLSLWSTLHPGEWVASDELKTDLFPFRKSKSKDEDKDKDKWWNSDDIRSHETFNHTYPEYLDANGNLVPKDKLEKQIREKVDELYGGYSKEIFGDVLAGRKSSALSWSVRIRSKRFVIDKSYSVFVFLEKYPEKLADWRGSEYLVGTYDVFINYAERNECPNCDSRADQDIEGYVHLTAKLQEKGHLKRSDLAGYLERNLYLGVLKSDSAVVISSEILQYDTKVISKKITNTNTPGEDLSVDIPYEYGFKIQVADPTKASPARVTAGV